MIKCQNYFRPYSNEQHFDFFPTMMLADPKFIHVLLVMLEENEVELLITDETKSQIFNTSQLLGMVCNLSENSTKLREICKKIFLRLKEDGEGILCRFNTNNSSMAKEDEEQIQDWSKFVSIISGQKMVPHRRYIHFNLLLDMVIIMNPVNVWFSCLPEIKAIDLFKNLLSGLPC